MKYVSLQVPAALYLRTLQFIGGEVTGLDAAALQAQATAAAETNRMLSELVTSLRSQLEEADQELWALREQRQLDRERAMAEASRPLRDDDYTAEAFDRDDSYPDHGPEDDAAAGLGLPSLTAGTLVEPSADALLAENVRDLLGEQAAEEWAKHESPETATEDPKPAEHEAPAEPAPTPAEEPQPQPQAAAPAPAAPRPAPAPAPQGQTPTQVAEAWLDTALVKTSDSDYLYLSDIMERAPENVRAITVSKLLRKRGHVAFKPIRQTGPKKGTQATAIKGVAWAPAQTAQEQPQEPARPLTSAERRKAASAELAALAKAARAGHPQPEINRDPEPEPAPVITPKTVTRPQTPPILHVKAPKPGSGIAVIRSDGTVTTVQKFAEDLEPDPAPIKPEDADGLTFDIWTDVKDGTNRPYTVADDVLALYGVDHDALDAAIKNPQRVEIRPESKTKGYPVLKFCRGDLDVVVGFRTPDRPKVIAAYVLARLEHGTHRVNHVGGGGAKRTIGLPGSVRVSVRQLRAAGLEIPDTWEAATQPVEVKYKGQVLGKMKVHLADKKQVQGDYQRLLRQAHAVDRREAARVG